MGSAPPHGRVLLVRARTPMGPRAPRRRPGRRRGAGLPARPTTSRPGAGLRMCVAPPLPKQAAHCLIEPGPAVPGMPPERPIDVNRQLDELVVLTPVGIHRAAGLVHPQLERIPHAGLRRGHPKMAVCTLKRNPNATQLVVVAGHAERHGSDEALAQLGQRSDSTMRGYSLQSERIPVGHGIPWEPALQHHRLAVLEDVVLGRLWLLRPPCVSHRRQLCDGEQGRGASYPGTETAGLSPLSFPRQRVAQPVSAGLLTVRRPLWPRSHAKCRVRENRPRPVSAPGGR